VRSGSNFINKSHGAQRVHSREKRRKRPAIYITGNWINFNTIYCNRQESYLFSACNFIICCFSPNESHYKNSYQTTSTRNSRNPADATHPLQVTIVPLSRQTNKQSNNDNGQLTLVTLPAETRGMSPPIAFGSGVSNGELW